MSDFRPYDRRSFLKTLGLGAVAAIAPFGCDRMHTLGSRDDSSAVKRVGGAVEEPYAKDFTPAFGIMPPIITPMLASLAVDYDALEPLARWHAEQGVSGIFAVSGSGEYYYLTEDEAVNIAARLVVDVSNDVPVFSGATNHEEYSKDHYYASLSAYNASGLESDLLGGESLYDQQVANNIAMAQRIADTGVDGIFVTIPRAVPFEKFTDWTAADWAYAAQTSDSADERYIRLRSDLDDIVVDYFTQVHDAVSCAVYGYEIPGSVVGYKFSADAFARLGQLERAIAIKDTTVSKDAIAAKVEAANGTIHVMDANVDNLYDTLQLGASGAINTTSNVASGLFAREIELVGEGSLSRARSLHLRIQLVDGYLMDGAGYPLNAKYALQEFGVPVRPYSRVTSQSVDMDRVRTMIDLIRDTRARYEAVTPTGIML